MKRDVIKAQELVERVYTELRNNQDLVAPQFYGAALVKLAKINAELTQLVDFCAESDQLNGGVN